MTKPIENKSLSSFNVDYSRKSFPDKIRVEIELNIPLKNPSYDLKAYVKRLSGGNTKGQLGESFILGKMITKSKNLMIFGIEPFPENGRGLDFKKIKNKTFSGKYSTLKPYTSDEPYFSTPIQRIEMTRISDNRFVIGTVRPPTILSMKLNLDLNIQRAIHLHSSTLTTKEPLSAENIVKTTFYPNGSYRKDINFIPHKINKNQFFNALKHTLTGIMELLSSDINRVFQGAITPFEWPDVIQRINLKYIEIAKDLEVPRSDAITIFNYLARQVKSFNASTIERYHMHQGSHTGYRGIGGFDRSYNFSCKFYPTKESETIFYLKYHSLYDKDDNVSLIRIEHRYKSNTAYDLEGSKSHTCATINSLISLIKRITSACENKRISPMVKFFKLNADLVPKDPYLFIRTVTTGQKYATPEVIIELADQLSASEMIKISSLSETAGKLMRNLSNKGVKRPAPPFIRQNGYYKINTAYKRYS